MGKQVSRKVTHSAPAAPCRGCGRQNPVGAERCWSCGAVLLPPAAPSAPPPVGVPLVVELDDDPVGRASRPSANKAFPLPPVRPRRKRSIWTGPFMFGLDDQPSCYWAIRTALWGAWLFPPMFLVSIVLAAIGLAKGEPSAGKILAGLVIFGGLYCFAVFALVTLIVRTASGIQW